MQIRYDKENDILNIVIEPEIGDAYEIETADFSVIVDERKQLNEIEIRNAKEFLAQVAAAKAVVPKPGKALQASGKPVWEDVDSSMIAAFKYNAGKQILDVMFHRTGVYSYFDVPADVVEGLREASSKGSYMRAMIIDMYVYEKGRR